jgi:hypothetical protein
VQQDQSMGLPFAVSVQTDKSSQLIVKGLLGVAGSYSSVQPITSVLEPESLSTIQKQKTKN